MLLNQHLPKRNLFGNFWQARNHPARRMLHEVNSAWLGHNLNNDMQVCMNNYVSVLSSGLGPINAWMIFVFKTHPGLKRSTWLGSCDLWKWRNQQISPTCIFKKRTHVIDDDDISRNETFFFAAPYLWNENQDTVINFLSFAEQTQMNFWNMKQRGLVIANFKKNHHFQCHFISLQENCLN